MDITVAETLESSISEIPIDRNFKLYAGPGAGKTTFLTNHIKRIIKISTKLNKNRKIACITYTNTAVNTLKERLQGFGESFEICTIHSFCYKYIVKPFLWTLSDCTLPLNKIDGHEEIKLRKSQIRDFKSSTKQFYLDEKMLSRTLGKLSWVLEGDDLILKFLKFSDGRIGAYSISKASYMYYKELYWSEGKLSHDDVLYFAYKILKEKKEVLRILRARFPYMLIDEFQDTSPLQTEIIKMIGEADTTVGVIGDVCQSIYSFQGANVELFKSFTLDEMNEYIISGNRRSTEQIILILNHIRGEMDFKQYSPEEIKGPKPKIVIEENVSFEEYLNNLYGEVVYLSYRNTVQESGDIISEDSNADRSWTIYYVLQAIEFAKDLEMGNAIKAMKRAYRKNQLFDDKSALMNLKRLIDKYEEFAVKSITEFYNQYIFGHYEVKAKITSGNIKVFYDSLTYQQLVNSINNVNKQLLNYKTIHQAKGDEFKNVCITLSPETDAKDLDFLLNPNMDNEAHRVYYVALSRAMENLFIKVDKIEKSTEDRLIQIGFEILRI